MAVPKEHHSNSRTGMRRAHDRLRKPSRSTCRRCHQPKQPHRVCGNCGYYRERQVISMEGV